MASSYLHQRLETRQRNVVFVGAYDPLPT